MTNPTASSFIILEMKDAPTKPRASAAASASALVTDALIADMAELKKLGPGNVGKLVPSFEGETTRGIRIRLGKAAKRIGEPVEAWIADNAVFFKFEHNEAVEQSEELTEGENNITTEDVPAPKKSRKAKAPETVTEAV